MLKLYFSKYLFSKGKTTNNLSKYKANCLARFLLHAHTVGATICTILPLKPLSFILDQLFELVEEFYLTRIYGKFDCDKKIDLKKIEDAMILKEKINEDKTCHFEIWKR